LEESNSVNLTIRKIIGGLGVKFYPTTTFDVAEKLWLNSIDIGSLSVGERKGS